MATIKLTYFDIDGGRGEPARLAMHIGGVPFEDHRISFAEFLECKNSFVFGAVPVIEIDGQMVAQCNGINRYVGKLAGLYPEDPLQALLCDEIMDAVEDIIVKIQPTLFIQDEEAKKAARTALVEGPISFYLERISQRLEARGGEYFADGRLTVADLKVFVWISRFQSGSLDYIPVDLAAKVAPLLVKHHDAVQAHDRVADYYARRAAAK